MDEEEVVKTISEMTVGELLDYVEQLGYQRNYTVNYREYLETLRSAKNEILNRFADLQAEIDTLKEDSGQPSETNEVSTTSTANDNTSDTTI
ncbi:hypothetical protein [Bacillus atrophaeus]|uniref:hypothetical protein n=1 Tax=Bacillus atrophaeus TaxID=1452 RepID=UPI0022803E04|nr:hypothetical protein [Bacillus atrophaeus]MCY7948002.1 hypothetical protein [Bacillus atrophaeus]MCY8098053.1 hypothetical protein [Bacillus atrophaeus]MCY9169977.1 hypothetical protein [Bacillus atrophaeus]MEC0740702.1 hypothetical protein [Bacillus atrophaeus]MEC0747034.1 hypothetical protein [Bacillus atrophaeus]